MAEVSGTLQLVPWHPGPRFPCGASQVILRTLVPGALVQGSPLAPLTWLGLLTSGQLSQASPTPSLSLSRWSRFGTLGQLSKIFLIPARKHQGNVVGGVGTHWLWVLGGQTGQEPQLTGPWLHGHYPLAEGQWGDSKEGFWVC